MWLVRVDGAFDLSGLPHTITTIIYILFIFSFPICFKMESARNILLITLYPISTAIWVIFRDYLIRFRDVTLKIRLGIFGCFTCI